MYFVWRMVLPFNQSVCKARGTRLSEADVTSLYLSRVKSASTQHA